MRAWPLEPRRRILVEYVLIAGVNDREEDARRLARLLSGLAVKVNVIPLNEDPTYLPGWKRPDEAAIDRFVRILADARVTVTVRRSKGPDASAACGQLKGQDGGPEEAGSSGRQVGPEELLPLARVARASRSPPARCRGGSGPRPRRSRRRCAAAGPRRARG